MAAVHAWEASRTGSYILHVNSHPNPFEGTAQIAFQISAHETQ